MKKLALIVALSTLPLTACGAGGVARPDDPTASAARGESKTPDVCRDTSASGEPLIIDWKPENRADLEIAMKKGVAVLHYDCKSLQLLEDCTADGVYDYVGISMKTQVITLANSDEAKVNLPAHGATIGAGLQRGSEIDIAMSMVGKRGTTFADLPRAELKGKCEGATHFVRSATLGAFAMSTATVGKTMLAVDLFKVGATAESSSKRGTQNKDGDSTACSKADPDDTKPTRDCAAVLQVKLIAVGQGNAPKGAPPAPTFTTGLQCAAGLVPHSGKCTTPNDRDVACRGDGHKEGDTDVCEALCKEGDVDTCMFWSDELMKQASHTEHAEAFDDRLAVAFKKECDAGRIEGCGGLGQSYFYGRGVTEDKPKGLELLKSACAGGMGRACGLLGEIYVKGLTVPVDIVKGVAALNRACASGDGLGCLGAAEAANGEYGKSVPRDKAKAADLFDRSCDGREPVGCRKAGLAYKNGDGVTADAAKAAHFFEWGCQGGDHDACGQMSVR